MRGSMWVLVLLTLGVGVWVLWPQRPAAAVRASTAPNSQTVLLPPVLDPCFHPPKAVELAPPPIPANLPGRLGLYVARFEPGEAQFSPSKVIALEANSIFPLASNYKTAVWLEALRQVDAGQLGLAEKFVVTSANQSLGDYPYDHTPVEGLALRMIQWSDNTATDILHARVGLGSLQPLADGLGLCQTRLLLPTKAWWTAQAGLGGPDFPKEALVNASQRFAKATPQHRLELAQALYARAQQVPPDRLNRILNPYFESGQWERMATLDRNLQNTSTPAEWARFLWMAFTGNGLSPDSQGRFRAVMAKGYGYRRLAVRYRYFGGKSGNTAGVLGFSGYIETDQARYVYVFLSDLVPEIYTLHFERPAFSLINRALLALGAVPK